MDNKEIALIKAVKKAVAKYGISGMSTRNIGEIAGINDAYIYKFFKSKEDLLLEAYKQENGKIFKVILEQLDKNHNLSVPFEEKAKCSFDIVWKYLLSNPERIIFCVTYYHSNFFNYATSYHNHQVEQLSARLSPYFNNEADCRQALYSMCSILYDSSYAVVTGRIVNSVEYERKVFETEQAILYSNMKKKNADSVKEGVRMMQRNAKWEISRQQQNKFIEALTKELTFLRSKVGISQGELASLIGVSRQTYSAVECGKRQMSWNTYLSLILFFDYNKETRQAIREFNAFPDEIIKNFNGGISDPCYESNGIAGIPKSITEKLDKQALHAIRTVVMVEYARCVNLPGVDVVKAFEGTTIRQTLTEIDVKTQKAIKNIKEENNNK